MAKKKTKTTPKNNPKNKWWETDSAKTVATIIAVLLIPMAVVAWSLFSKSEYNIEETGNKSTSDNIAMDSENEEIDINLEDIEVEGDKPQDSNRNRNAEDFFMNRTEENKDIMEKADDDEMANNSEEVEPSGSLNLRDFFNKIRERREANLHVRERIYVETEEDTIVKNDNNNQVEDEMTMTEEEESLLDQLLSSTKEDSQNEEQEKAVNPEEENMEVVGDENREFTGDRELGGMEDTTIALDKVNTLPFTSSTYKYEVQKGDNVYSISMKVCGNDSFYLSNLYRNYLKVGETIEVDCD